MQIIIHPSAQRQGTGNGDSFTEPDFKLTGLFVKATAFSGQPLGTVTIKVQHSPDGGSEWIDVPGAAITGLNATGTTTVGINPAFACFDTVRLVWVFDNVNSMTFYAALLGIK